MLVLPRQLVEGYCDLGLHGRGISLLVFKLELELGVVLLLRCYLLDGLAQPVCLPALDVGLVDGPGDAGPARDLPSRSTHHRRNHPSA